jgi:hypothetical protein
LIERYCEQNLLDLQTAVLSVPVPVRSNLHHQPSVQGKVAYSDQPMRSGWLRDIHDIVQRFDLGIFHVCGRSFRQPHGAAIGNQISPVLSGVSVSRIEHYWAQQHSQILDCITIARYVDNRPILAPEFLQENETTRRQLQQLCNVDFCKTPVELEPVKDPEEFLGFVASPSAQISVATSSSQKCGVHSDQCVSFQRKSCFDSRTQLSQGSARKDIDTLRTFVPAARGAKLPGS